MRCAWTELLSILPIWMRSDVDTLGKEDLQEFHLRLGQAPVLRKQTGFANLSGRVSAADLSYVINTASHYSPWTAASMSMGYITASGGHRIGICGDAVVSADKLTGIRNVRSVCIRVARDFPGIAIKASTIKDNILIIGPPGSGKTTFLRDLIRHKSKADTVCVVDERGEIFPTGMYTGVHTDILTGISKPMGLDILTRTMGPKTVAVDEITQEEDAAALLKACFCGVQLIATAHASSAEDLQCRSVYKPLIEQGIFQNLIVLREDKSWHVERMKQ